jgi:peptidylprolyl isomerase
MSACNGEKQQGKIEADGKISIPPPPKPEPSVDSTTSTGLVIKDIKVGSGPKPFKGKLVKIHYVGMTQDGIKFDNSRDRGNPVIIRLGTGDVMKGWEEGISGMRVGGKRRLVIPSSLQLPGKTNIPLNVPAGKTLIFDIDLLDIEI